MYSYSKKILNGYFNKEKTPVKIRLKNVQNILRKANEQHINSIVLQVDLGMQDISSLRYSPVRLGAVSFFS